MIANFRFLVSKLVPDTIKWRLVRNLPEISTLLLRFLQGLDAPWTKDPFFAALYKQSSERILLDRRRAYILYSLCARCQTLRGNFAEVGVYKGGGSRIMGAFNRKVIGFDTFEGLPAGNKSNNPFWSQGDLKASYEDVSKFLSGSNVELVRGHFPESARRQDKEAEFALVHLDGDLYETTMDACIFFYPRLVFGGVMLIDDYNFLSCPGVKKAVDKFFSDKSETVIPLGSGQCMMIKGISD